MSLNNVSIVAGQVLASLVDCGFDWEKWRTDGIRLDWVVYRYRLVL